MKYTTGKAILPICTKLVLASHPRIVIVFVVFTDNSRSNCPNAHSKKTEIFRKEFLSCSWHRCSMSRLGDQSSALENHSSESCTGSNQPHSQLREAGTDHSSHPSKCPQSQAAVPLPDRFGFPSRHSSHPCSATFHCENLPSSVSEHNGDAKET